MMKKFGILLLSTLLFFQFSIAQKKEQEVPGFRGIKWGTHVDSVYKNGEKVELVQVKGKDKPDIPNAYEIKNDDMMIGAAELNKIRYYFNNEDRFYKIRLTGDKDYLEDMGFILKHKFGEPLKVEKTGEVRTQVWSVDNVEFTLVNPYQSGDFTLVIASNWEKIEAYRKNTSVKDF
jgi:hypothetical protein